MKYSLGLYEKSMPNEIPLKDKLYEAKQGGFDFLEISVDETDEKLTRLEWTQTERTELVRAMFDAGLKIETMCLSGHRRFPIGSENDTVRMRGMEIMRQAIDLSLDIGVRIIQIAGYDEYYQPSNDNTKRLFSENLHKSVEYATQKGVILAFETMETEFMNTVEKAMKYVHEINSPYLQVYPDLGNITNAAVQYGTSVNDDLRTGSGHIAAMHLKETIPGKFREIPYGTGHVDFTGGIKTALSLGTRKFVGEFWYVGNDDWREQLAAANKFLRERIECK